MSIRLARSEIPILINKFMTIAVTVPRASEELKTGLIQGWTQA